MFIYIFIRKLFNFIYLFNNHYATLINQTINVFGQYSRQTIAQKIKKQGKKHRNYCEQNVTIIQPQGKPIANVIAKVFIQHSIGSI